MPEPEAREGSARQQLRRGDQPRLDQDRLNRLIEAGPFHVEIARTFPLEQAAEAHRALDQHYLGTDRIANSVVASNANSAVCR